MAGFKVALINEIEKLYKKKKLFVALILSVVFIVIGQVAVIGVRSGFGLRGASSMEFPMLVLSIVVNTILPLFTALITIDCFTGEFSHNTMKIAITRPITRLKLFTAKLSAIFIFILFNLAAIMILSLAAGIMFNSNSFTLKGVMNILVSYIVSSIPLFILAMLITVFANMVRGGTAVFFISIIVFLVFKILEMVLSRYSGLFFTSMFDWYNLWIMNPVPILKLTRKFIMLMSHGIILFTVGYYLFDKKDF